VAQGIGDELGDDLDHSVRRVRRHGRLRRRAIIVIIRVTLIPDPAEPQCLPERGGGPQPTNDGTRCREPPCLRSPRTARVRGRAGSPPAARSSRDRRRRRRAFCRARQRPTWGRHGWKHPCRSVVSSLDAVSAGAADGSRGAGGDVTPNPTCHAVVGHCERRPESRGCLNHPWGPVEAECLIFQRAEICTRWSRHGAAMWLRFLS